MSLGILEVELVRPMVLLVEEDDGLGGQVVDTGLSGSLDGGRVTFFSE